MARKGTPTLTKPKQDEAMAEFVLFTEIRYEMAKQAYDYQDAKTRAMIDRMVNRLRLGATGYIDLPLDPPASGTVPVKIERQYLDQNLLYVAMELLKDLALFDVQIESYKFPPSLCTNCGAEIVIAGVKEKRKRRVAA